MQAKRKILLIGWDAADWKIINPLLDAGLMPSLESLVNNGVMGNLATLEPPFSPMLWTSIATGMYPDKHGIIAFTEPTPDGKGIRAVSSLSRKVKAVWNILSQNDYKVNIVGWWPSHPAEPVNGVMISNHYCKVNATPDKWPMLKNAVHPHELEELFAWLRVHPSELGSEHLLPFVPDAIKVDQTTDNRLNIIANNLAEASSIHAATTWLMENTEWDFTAVYLDSIDHFCHAFMNFHPPKLKGIPDDLFNLYKDVVNSAYRFHDMMLGRLLELAGEDTTVILVSDHGFHSDHLRPSYISDEPAAPTVQHRDHGIICMKGPGIKKDEHIFGATLLDITPTILTLCNLPIGEDMDGVPLMQAFDNPLKILKTPSWEKVEGNSGMHPSDIREDTFQSNEALEHLINLGYIERPDENIQKAIEKTVDESQYNLARSYIGMHRFQDAANILEKLYYKKQEPRFATRLITSLIESGQLKEAKTTIKSFKEKSPVEIELLNKSVLENSIKLEHLNATADSKSNNEKESLLKALDKTRKKLKEIKNALVIVEMNEADILLKRGKYAKALELYEKIEKKSRSLGIYIQIGTAHLKLNNWLNAEKAFKKVISVNPELAAAHHGLGISYIERKEYDNGINHILESLALNHNNPSAHFLLGRALYELEEYRQASVSLEICLLMSPNMGIARNLLIEIYEKHLHQINKADVHKQFFKQKSSPLKQTELSKKHKEIESRINSLETKNEYNPALKYESPVIVVTGLPRSGTSLMMQILEKTGMPLFIDDKRAADENNPNGYYEHQWVKRLASDNSWLEQARGSAIKIVSHLLFYLPPKHNYKLIFMQRNLKEVVISQNKMLSRNKKMDENTYPYNIELAYARNLEKAYGWIEKNHNVEVLFVDHAELINNPISVVEKLCEFLGVKTDIMMVASVVDKKLYRVKIDEGIVAGD
jgi:predicted AlkP superfamily phosphohydrolase/phosphomutase/tetratricopeptide (TPR) repeat protein